MERLTGHLRSWAASELKNWEQAGLKKVVSGSALSAGDFEELSQYFIEDAGLAPVPTTRPRLSFSDSTVRARAAGALSSSAGAAAFAPFPSHSNRR
jgi:hypothetical protein